MALTEAVPVKTLILSPSLLESLGRSAPFPSPPQPSPPFLLPQGIALLSEAARAAVCTSGEFAFCTFSVHLDEIREQV